MSVDPSPAPGAALRVSLATRMAAAERRADQRLDGVIDDYFRADGDRLDDRARAAIHALIEGSVRGVEEEIGGHAARLLATRGETGAADALVRDNGGVLGRLTEAGLLRDRALMGEIVAQARIDLIDEALAANRAPGIAPTLLTRLSEAPDAIVRARATAYLIADSRRRLPAQACRAELPAELHGKLAWWITAALRERLAVPSAAADRALSDAATCSIAALDEGDGAEAAAVQLAVALDADAPTLAQLLPDTLAEGRAMLFVALLAHALGVELGEARALMLEPDGDRLWLALRALGIERDVLARIGWMLGEADHARDVEALPDAIDAAAGVAPEEAGAVVAPLTLARDFRVALRALARSTPQ